MDLDLTEEQQMLRTMARDFLSKECPRTLVRELEDDPKGYSPELWSAMAELGWTGLAIPEEYGGQGMGFLDLVILLQEMGRNIVPGPFFSTVVLGAMSVSFAGSEEQKQELLPRLARGELIMTLAHMEPSATYDASGIAVKAEAKDEGFVIKGAKLFVENAQVADYMVCAARTAGGTSPEEGITLFVIDARSPGIDVSVVPTIADDKLCEVIFDDVLVPESSVLGTVGEGWPILERVLRYATLAKCAEMVGGSEAVLDMTVAYVKERTQYNRLIGSFQAIQHYCANMWTRLVAGRNMLYHAAWKLSEGLPADLDIAAAKGWTNECYKFVTERSIQCHGAIGLTRDHDLGLYYRRAKSAELAYGDGAYHLEAMAKQMGL